MKSKQPIDYLKYVHKQLQKVKRLSPPASHGAFLRREESRKVYGIISEFLTKTEQLPTANIHLDTTQILQSGISDWEIELISMQVFTEIEMRKSRGEFFFGSSIN